MAEPILEGCTAFVRLPIAWLSDLCKRPRAESADVPALGSRLSLTLATLDLTLDSHHPVFFTTYRGLSTAAAPRSLALNRSTMSLLNSASLPSGACVTVIGQFSM